MDPCDRAVISVRKPSRQSDEAFSLSSACWRSGEGILPMKPAQHKIFFEDGSFVDICGDFIFYRPGDDTGEGVVDDRIIGYITEDDRSSTGVVKFTCEDVPFSSPVTLDGPLGSGSVGPEVDIDDFYLQAPMLKYNRDNNAFDFPADLRYDWEFFSASEIVELEMMNCVRQSEATEQILFSKGRSHDVSPQVTRSTVSTVGVSPLLFGFEQLLSRAVSPSVTTDSRGANYLVTPKRRAWVQLFGKGS